MARAMIFIDGTWLYTNTPRLAEIVERKDYHIDFGNLPIVLADKLADRVSKWNQTISTLCCSNVRTSRV